jgi:hypothetical protein
VLLEAIETFNEGEEAVFEWVDVVCRVHAFLAKGKQWTERNSPEIIPVQQNCIISACSRPGRATRSSPIGAAVTPLGGFCRCIGEFTVATQST